MESVERQATEDAASDDVSLVPAYESPSRAAVRSSPPVMAYGSAVAGRPTVPEYLPLLVLSRVLTWMAYAGYALVVVVGVLGIVAAVGGGVRNAMMAGLPVLILCSGVFRWR